MAWPVGVGKPDWSQTPFVFEDSSCIIDVHPGGVTFHECQYHAAMIVPVTARERDNV